MAGNGKGFIAVHVGEPLVALPYISHVLHCANGILSGAGYHSPANAEMYKKICRQACIQAINILRQKQSALEAIKGAVVALENSPWTNAGTGSNLTVQGTVECDASIMDGQTLHYGAVGAISGVKNPILVAESLLQTQLKGPLSLGRIPPSTLVGRGALEWAVKQKISTATGDALITDSAQKVFMKHKRKLDLLEEGDVSHKMRRLDGPTPSAPGGGDGPSDEKLNCTTNPVLLKGDEDILHDTVGAICVDSTGRVVSAVSSGGIVLKQPGRLGQAALYGCGCWAENDIKFKVGVGVSTSGCGEHLTKALLARECGGCLKYTSDPTLQLSSVFRDKFLDSTFLRNIEQKLGGALAVRVNCETPNSLEVEVLWAHTTDSMCLAYMSTEDLHPKAQVSRLTEEKKPGKSFVVSSERQCIPL